MARAEVGGGDVERAMLGDEDLLQEVDECAANGSGRGRLGGSGRARRGGICKGEEEARGGERRRDGQSRASLLLACGSRRCLRRVLDAVASGFEELVVLALTEVLAGCWEQTYKLQSGKEARD